MKVKCLYNCLENIKDQNAIAVLGRHMNVEHVTEDLQIGIEYTVYGLVVYDGIVWYSLHVDDSVAYPLLLPHVYFSVIDAKVSRYWHLSITTNRNNELVASFECDAWLQDPLFAEKLIDEEPEAVEIFQKYKSLMDNEFE